jgi:hypothetical protein
MEPPGESPWLLIAHRKHLCVLGEKTAVRIGVCVFCAPCASCVNGSEDLVAALLPYELCGGRVPEGFTTEGTEGRRGTAKAAPFGVPALAGLSNGAGAT